MKTVICINNPEIKCNPVEFTHAFTRIGSFETSDKPDGFAKVVYLGKCPIDGDMFVAYTHEGGICIYKGHLNSGQY